MRIVRANPESPMSAGRPRAARHIILLLLSGLPIAASPISPAQAQTVAPVPAEASTQVAAFVTEASQRFGIPVAWIRALMRVESANDVRAVSMQLQIEDGFLGLNARNSRTVSSFATS